MTFSQVSMVATTEEQSKPLTFTTEDFVDLMGYEVGDVGKLVAH